MTSKLTPSAIASDSSDASEGSLWDVQEILAERTTVLGDRELLVVWKTSWIPKNNMIEDGPELRKWEAARKCQFTVGKNAMHILLAVEAGSSMAADCDELDYRKHCKRNDDRHNAAATSSATLQQRDVVPDTASPTKRKQPENGSVEETQ